MSEPKDSPLPDTRALAAEHERLGRAAVEIVSEYARTLDDAPVCSRATPAELDALFDEPLPVEGVSAEEVFEKFRRDVVPHAMNIPSPRYFGLFNPTPLPVAVWADVLISALNQKGVRDSGLRSSSSPGELLVYASEQSHYSFVKSVDILGLGREGLRKIDTDERFHIRTDLLRETIKRDLDEGHTPVCVAGAAGATSTGVVDPLDELADIAHEFGLWFHVDAAYGGALAFSEKHRARLKGIERADSVTIDPHKWMFVPFGCGALLVRGGGRVLRDAFDITPEYLSEDRGGADVEYDFF